MLERNASVKTELAPPGATPTLDTLPRRLADFATLGEALDYAAKGRRGLNFHDARGTLTRAYPFRRAARGRACRMRGASSRSASSRATASPWSPRPAPEFAACFFGAVYAGAWPVPLPLPTSFGGREAYVDQLGVQLKSCDPALFLYPPELADFCQAAAADEAASPSRDWESLAERRAGIRRPSQPRARRHRLSAIFERLDPLPARRRGHPSRAARQPPCARRRPRRSIDTDRVHLVAALVSRHGPGRLLPVAGRDADVGRLSEDRGFRPPPARLARPDHPQSGHDASATRRPSATTSARAG